MVDVTLPQLGESVTEGTISKWLVKEGDVVAQGQPLLSVSTDKADAEVPAPAAGRVAKLLAKEGDIVAVKTVVAQIEEGAGPVASPKNDVPKTKTPPPPQPSEPRSPLASPSVRKDALELGVNLASVQGTGEHGRITKDDVARAKSPEASPATEAPQPSRPTQLAQMINTGGGFVPP